MAYGDKYRFEHPDLEPREYVHVDPDTLSKEERRHWNASRDDGPGAVVLLRNVETGGHAAITPQWLRNGTGHAGKWVVVP